MQFLENFKEGLTSIKGNLLRSSLTATIIAIGISSLVGIITAIDGMKASIEGNLSSLGANTYTLRSINNNSRGNEGGKARKIFPPIKYAEFQRFQEKFQGEETMSLSAYLSWNAEIKFGSEKTNPNVRIVGIDHNYLTLEDAEFAYGRDLTPNEVSSGAPVVILGDAIASKLFPVGQRINPVGKFITAYGASFRIVGVLKSKGALNNNQGVDRAIMIPIEKARMLSAGSQLNYNLKVGLGAAMEIEPSIGRATPIMRAIRQDRPGEENSFEIKRDQSLAESLNEISGQLKIGAIGIGFITILGAAIGLMNIMMVSVTERTREIGVRKALGATPAKIKQQFLIEAITICLIGGFAGVLLGFIFGNVVARTVDAKGLVFPVEWMFLGFVVSVLVGVISGYMPAAKASKLDPIESLRFE
ncbi:ABC transporter permease [Persicobacter diffluens]|uniref:ABC transporter permease n=1 Tax=Persicobacter diffluens TaxID=981 RepID=A0AAN5AJ34_9BACT|nr:ABC transporter permease [Persicobacter diffluens]